MSQDIKLSLYSAVPGNNNSSPPDGWPEGMAPSKVNDSAREMMTRLREWYTDAQWINEGNTQTFVSGTQFKIVGIDQTEKYKVGRRVEAIGSTTGTIYGTITASTFAADTTVTVSWDSGSLQNESLTISYNIVDNNAGSKDAVENSVVVRNSDGSITGTATAAKYSDLAERYSHANNDLYNKPGTVVVVCKHSGYEVQVCTKAYDETVVGVVSNKPGFILNNDGKGSLIGLRGKVPVRVIGNVKKGDLLVTSNTLGHAQKANWLCKILYPRAVFAVALEDAKNGSCLALV